LKEEEDVLVDEGRPLTACGLSRNGDGFRAKEDIMEAAIFFFPLLSHSTAWDW